MHRRTQPWHVVVGTLVLALAGLVLVTRVEPSASRDPERAERSDPGRSPVDPEDHLVAGLSIPESSAWEPTGNFRMSCRFSHLAHDDPIVHPGRPGRSHLHMFFGNADADADSTYESLRDHGDATCQGGPLNRSGYWAPAVLDAEGRVVVPEIITVYYKATGTREQIASVQPLPEGLRMIAGYDATTGESSHFEWYCELTQDKGLTIPTCPDDELVGVMLAFPSCWDGRSLDSPDHRQHMAYKISDPHTGEVNCPDTHPVRLPEFTLGIWFEHDGDSSSWHLSSDREPGHAVVPNGSSFHSDWFGGWNLDVQQTWTDECLRAMRNCVGGELGDGTRLADLPDDPLPRRIDPPPAP